MNIAISRGDNIGSYPKYESWLKNSNPTITCYNLYNLPERNSKELLKTCSGLLLTGGNDISPDLYGKPDETNRCPNIDKQRDDSEIKFIHEAIKLGMPILAICRGQQILNVALGGTLIVDIEEDHNKIIKHKLDGDQKDNCFHTINIELNSILNTINKSQQANVNSFHHQALDRVADCLKVTAIAEDGIIEAIEWKESKDKSFLLGVQWHPERMDIKDEDSNLIAKVFLEASNSFLKK